MAVMQDDCCQAQKVKYKEKLSLNDYLCTFGLFCPHPSYKLPFFLIIYL